MSLQICLAHSGQRLQADPISFASFVGLSSNIGSLAEFDNRPEALKSWIANRASIPIDRQILITGRGKNVRQQNLLTEVRMSHDGC